MRVKAGKILSCHIGTKLSKPTIHHLQTGIKDEVELTS
jgi:hypothetical protein